MAGKRGQFRNCVSCAALGQPQLPHQHVSKPDEGAIRKMGLAEMYDASFEFRNRQHTVHLDPVSGGAGHKRGGMWPGKAGWTRNTLA